MRGQIRLLPVAEIRVIAADGDGVSVRTSDARFHARQTLQELEHRLGPHGFLRVHRAFLVNLKHVVSIDGFFNDSYLIKLDSLQDLTVPVSRRHAAGLKAAIRL